MLSRRTSSCPPPPSGSMNPYPSAKVLTAIVPWSFLNGSGLDRRFRISSFLLGGFGGGCVLRLRESSSCAALLLQGPALLDRLLPLHLLECRTRLLPSHQPSFSTEDEICASIQVSASSCSSPRASEISRIRSSRAWR